MTLCFDRDLCVALFLFCLLKTRPRLPIIDNAALQLYTIYYLVLWISKSCLNSSHIGQITFISKELPKRVVWRLFSVLPHYYLLCWQTFRTKNFGTKFSNSSFFNPIVQRNAQLITFHFLKLPITSKMVGDLDAETLEFWLISILFRRERNSCRWAELIE